ncbi:5766_t:CDS:2, partial [Ambispora gerdemannii]
ESSEEFHEDCITSTIRRSADRMFWRCFSWIDLVKHMPEKLKNVNFQEDNAPVRTAKFSCFFLTSSNLELLPWLAQSPALNPIENIWSFIEVKPSRIVQLERWVKEEWDAIPENYYRNLIKSIPRRVQAVIAANEGQTKY